MKTYLVGGAVRDRLLGRPVEERDWVVVGATPETMRRLGFRQVGRDFPVFLHPETAEEYALARRERKTGPGYAGFVFEASPMVTLEEDLLRRDLTINAMAETPDGTLVDPYGGQADLQGRWLRHVSPAFSEDPVRILRVARFAARFAGEGFRVAPETLGMMQAMVASGEVDALVAERVWKELERALRESRPAVFFEVLSACGALPRLFPPAILQGLPALQQAVSLSADPAVRLAALLHPLVPAEVESLSQRYRLPQDVSQLALLVSRYGEDYRALGGLEAARVVAVLQRVDAFRRLSRFDRWREACAAVSETDPALPLFYRWRACFDAAVSIDMTACVAEAAGPEIARRIQQARIAAVAQCLAAHSP